MRNYEQFRIGDLFDIHPTKSYGLTNPKLFSTAGKTPVIVNSSRDNGIGGYVGLEPTEKGNIITFSDTTTADSIFYQPRDFIGYSHVQGVYPRHANKWTQEALLYVVVNFRKATAGRFDYANKFNRAIAVELKITLPIKKNYGAIKEDIDKIDFDFMSTRVCELELARIRELELARIRELVAYLKVTGLTDYRLTADEEAFLKNYQNLTGGGRRYKPFCLGDLFGKATRGKRLKSLDRVDGDLPFVTAGEADTGISAYIGNPVEVFQTNTITIDMFGSAKYRNYCYGADDHVAVVHTKRIEKHAVIFITAAIHKVSYNSLWDYSNNFYAKDADSLTVYLPVDGDGNPDYDYMSAFIRIQQKLAIKNVAEWKDRELVAYNAVTAV
jgi:hypothetical protein